MLEEENEGQTDDSEITFSKKRSSSKKKSGNSGSSRMGNSRESPLKASKGGNKSHSPSLKALKSSKEKLFQ